MRANLVKLVWLGTEIQARDCMPEIALSVGPQNLKVPTNLLSELLASETQLRSALF